MALATEQVESFLEKGFTRRQVGRIASLLTAGAALPFYSEHAMAQQAEQRMLRGSGRRVFDPDAVRISSNENPMGPAPKSDRSDAKIAPHGWRYSPSNEQGEFIKAIAGTEDVPEDHVAPYAGSSDPLHRVSCAFTSPQRSWTMANPGYGGGAPELSAPKLPACLCAPITRTMLRL